MPNTTQGKASPLYDVSVCPDTGRQFLVEVGKNGNIVELTPVTIKRIKYHLLLEQSNND